MVYPEMTSGAQEQCIIGRPTEMFISPAKNVGRLKSFLRVASLTTSAFVYQTTKQFVTLFYKLCFSFSFSFHCGLNGTPAQ